MRNSSQLTNIMDVQCSICKDSTRIPILSRINPTFHIDTDFFKIHSKTWVGDSVMATSFLEILIDHEEKWKYTNRSGWC